MRLGRTGLTVSRFILGTMQMGWIVNEEDSFKLLDVALELGITTLDTADIYSKWGDGSYAGKSEEILGRWIKDRGNRDDLILATKVRGEMSEKPNDGGLSRTHILTVQFAHKPNRIVGVLSGDSTGVAMDENGGSHDGVVRTRVEKFWVSALRASAENFPKSI